MNRRNCKNGGSANAALAYFIAQANIFKELSGLLVFNESMSTFVSLAVIYQNVKQFLGSVLGRMLFVCCKPINSPKVEKL